MKRSEILAELRKAVPDNADYGRISQSRLGVLEWQRILKQLVAAIQLDPRRPGFSPVDNVRMGMKEW